MVRDTGYLGSPVQWPVLITKHIVDSSEIQEYGVFIKIGFCTLVKPQHR